ncbi:MAG: hypothetical protein LKE40_07950 [Spirochaetia bacterium]|jgi:hypothetical protein|nr:hypothetical protein [Spirochaetia bacterium]
MAMPQRNDGKIHLHPRKNGANLYASSNEAYEKDGRHRFRIVDRGTIVDDNVCMVVS